jgi:hypothetical protein
MYTKVKTSPTFWATSVIFINQPKESDRPLGENSPNLGTLIISDFLSSSLITFGASH